MITTLCFYLYSTSVFKDTGYHQLCIAGLLCFARGVLTNQWSKYFIISRVACKYTCIKTQQLKFYNFIVYATFFWTWTTWRNWTVKSGVPVSDVARYNSCHLSTKQRLRDVTRLLGQLKIDAAKNGDGR